MIYVSEGASVGFSILLGIACIILFPIALAALSYPSDCYSLKNLNFTKKEIASDFIFVSLIFWLSWACIGIAGNMFTLCFSEGEVVEKEKIYLYNEVPTTTNKNMVLYEGKSGEYSSTDSCYALIIKNEENEPEILELTPSYTQIKYDSKAVEPYVLKECFRKDSWIFYSTDYDYSICFPESFRSGEE